MEFRDFSRFFRRGWIILLIGLILGAAGGYGFSLLQTPQYQAEARDFVGTTSTSNVGDLSTGTTFTTQVVASYATIATDPLVLNPVIKSLGLDLTAAQLADDVTATSDPGTVIIDITATSSSPQTAAAIANGVSANLVAAVAKLTFPTSDSQAPIKITQTRMAVAPTSPLTPKIPINVALGAVIGLVLGLLIALVYNLVDTRIRSLRDIELVTDATVLAGVPRSRRAERNPLLTRDDVRSARGEAYRLLRTNLQFLDISRGARSIVVTSPLPGDGKTTTVANLAIAIAETGAPVVLVDADLRRPALHEVLGIDGAAGLTDVLIGELTLDEVLQPWGDGKVMVLPAGRIPPNPSELLQSKAMADLITTLKKRFGTVLFDAAPLNPVTDSAILAARTNGALVVLAEGRTTRAQLQKALERLGNVNGRVLGLVSNMQRATERRGDGYGAYVYGEQPVTDLMAVEAARASTNV